jgi:hypothetical protein
MKIPIYHYAGKCWSCKKELDIYYHEELASTYVLGNVKEIDSKTQNGKTTRNICPHCNSVQGSRFVRTHVLDVCSSSNIRDFCLWVEGVLRCEKCGQDIDYEIDTEEPSRINDFFLGRWGNKCLSCMNEEAVDALVEILNGLSRCIVCDRLIYDGPDLYDSIILDDTTIVHSKPNKHHLNYEKNQIIIVCSECHTKIHNSKKKKYKEYQPVDQRTN